MSGSNASRVLSIDSGVTVVISGLTIAHGYASGDGGGLYNAGSMTITGCTISEDSASFHGGGLYNAGIMTINDSSISGNSVTGWGGGLMNAGTLTVNDSSISENSAYWSGGGIQNGGGTALTITGCTIARDVAEHGSGGGMENMGGGTIAIIDTTISGNSASDSSYGYGYGGGINNMDGGTLTITNGAIADNSATHGGGINNGSGTATLKNTIVADNSGDDISGSLAANYCLVGIDTGSNLTESPGGGTADANGNLIGGPIHGTIDPLLGSLGDNGGPTQTMALLPGSPAIDHGSNDLALDADGNPLTTDQRGYSRIVDGNGDGVATVDIGAAEVQKKIDFSQVSVASVAYGQFSYESAGWRLVPYENKIYFAPWNDGTADPSKVLCYDPANGLSNGVNHTTIASTTGRFATMQVMDNLLYMADTTGGLRTYNGTAVNTLTGTPFDSSSYVYAMAELNGDLYFGTVSGAIWEYHNSTDKTWEKVYQNDKVYPSINRGGISDLASWHGSLYAGLTGYANDGFAIKSNGSDVHTWQTVITGVYNGSNIFLTTPDYIYAMPTDDVSSHSSTVRRSSDGVNFTSIAGPGPFKFPLGNPMYYDGTAYIFENGRADGTISNGFLVADDGATATTTEEDAWTYHIVAATELNGQVYAIGLNTVDYVVGNVYLLKVGPTTPVNPLVVTTTTDETDPNDALVSLREAAAYADANPGSTITFDPSLVSAGPATITLTQGELDITNTTGTTTITGLGANQLTVSGDNLSRVFEIGSGVTADISGLTITAGNASDYGGGIYNDGTLTISDTTISGNSAVKGGGIYNAENGELALTDSTVDGNSASDSGGGILNYGTSTISASTVSNNATSGWGGGICYGTYRSALTIADSVISGNTAYWSGGGIMGNGSDGIGGYGGSLTITDCTIADNVAQHGNGGGMEDIASSPVLIVGTTISGNSAPNSAYYGMGGGINNLSSLRMINCTLTGNTAGTAGGGIYNSFYPGAVGNMQIDDSTIAANSAGIAGGIYNDDADGTTTALANTIVADNTLADGKTPSDISGTATANYSLIGYSGGWTPGVGSADNLTGVDPLLRPLQNNGGPTETMALLPGSPAIDAGSNALAVDANGNALTTDQRGPGYPRIVNGTVDIGAYEVQSIATTISDVSGSGTYGGTATLSATLLDGTTPVSGETIEFSLDGGQSYIASAVTNASGVATATGVSLVGIHAGNCANGVYAYFAGDSNVNPNLLSSNGTGTLTVDQAPLTITANSQTGLTYGGTQPNLVPSATTVSVTGLLPGDTIDYSKLVLTTTDTINPNSHVYHAGTYSIDVAQGTSGSPNSDYDITYDSPPGTLTIDQAPLTITTDSKGMLQGTTPATLPLTVSYAGLAAGDRLDTPPIITTTATHTSPAGTYPITAGGAADSDYSPITYQNTGILTVEPAVNAAYLMPDPLSTTSPAQNILYVWGTAGNDSILINSAGSSNSVLVVMTGVPRGTFGSTSQPISRIVVHGVAGTDSITVSPAVTLPAWLYLDNGTGGTIQGGGGRTYEFGDPGTPQQPTKLYGGAGRSILIGGAGMQTLNAGAGDAILIGGKTAYDASTPIDTSHDAALLSILNEWSSTSDYATRVGHTTNGANGQSGTGGQNHDSSGNYFYLKRGTVYNDFAADTLNGKIGGLDLFFRSIGDTLNNSNQPGEVPPILV